MPDAEPTFENALAELEAVLRKLEDGSTTLDDSLAAYERGIGLLKACQAKLSTAELRIQQLLPTPDTPAAVKPFAHKSKDPF
jgi:exodeoxyribonuclease VII small subunit